MDQDQLAGGAREFGGKVKDAVGGFTGDAKTQAEGKGPAQVRSRGRCRERRHRDP